MSELLHHRALGGDDGPGPRIAFCHGLFGQGRNWTQVAKSLTDVARPVLLDMPNHGRSAWTEEFDYLAAADAVGRTLESIDADQPWVLVGHSMGGKIAMLLALRRPELVDRLAVIDIAPVTYGEAEEFRTFVAAMEGMDLTAIATREAADAVLAPAVPSPSVRAFLLQNLRRDEATGWRWQMNLPVLGAALASLRSWPAEAIAGRSYPGPVLWLAGETSDYVTAEMVPAMRALFPRVRLVTVKDAGHWVHSEQPEVTTAALRALVTQG